MKAEKKAKVKKWLTEKKKWIITTGIFLLAGGIVMLVGFHMTGFSLIKWLQSPWATTFFIFLISGVLIIGGVWWIFKMKDITKGDE